MNRWQPLSILESHVGHFVHKSNNKTIGVCLSYAQPFVASGLTFYARILNRPSLSARASSAYVRARCGRAVATIRSRWIGLSRLARSQW